MNFYILMTYEQRDDGFFVICYRKEVFLFRDDAILAASKMQNTSVIELTENTTYNPERVHRYAKELEDE